MANADRRPSLFQAYEHAADLVAGVKPDQLPDPTSCPQFDVAALVDHLVGAGHRATALGQGAPLADGEFPHVALADAPGELRAAGREARLAWSDPARLDATIELPWGEVYTGATVVDMYLAELATHTWDLAAASGQLARLGADLAGPALDGARAMLKPEYRDLLEVGSPYGQEQPAPDGATSWELLAAFMGRQPRPSAGAV
jgi:uncharacterized protein (TIGR03086 family)